MQKLFIILSLSLSLLMAQDYSLSFDGVCVNSVCDRVEVDDTSLLKPIEGITIEAWIKHDGNGSGGFIVGKETAYKHYLLAITSGTIHSRIKVENGP